MVITQAQREMLAGLVQLPSYQLLLDVLREENASILDRMLHTDTPTDLLLLTRQWQYHKIMLERLRGLPLEAQDSLATLPEGWREGGDVADEDEALVQQRVLDELKEANLRAFGRV